jgi:hypothetical protein
MSIAAAIIDITDNKAVAVKKYWRGITTIDPDERVLLAADPLRVHGTFKAVEIAGAATHQLVIPNDDGSIILVGLTIAGDKVNGGSIEVRWTDGTDTSIIIKPTTTDAPVNLFMQFASRIQGWQDARIDVIVTGVIIGSVMANYVKVPKGLPFAEWDALR